MPETALEMALRHVVEGERHTREQRAIIEQVREIDAEPGDIGVAKKLLAEFEQTQRDHMDQLASAPVVVTYEDRENALPGVEILACSLHRHSPGLAMMVYSPLAEVAARLGDLPNVTWVPTHDLIGQGWNVKPIILRRGLESHERVLWLDTDIVLCGDLRRQIARFATDALVVSQEWRTMGPMASELRARGFGLEVARTIPFGVCSGSILAGRHHASLFERWLTLLEGDAYRAAQKMPVGDRPVAFVSDQDVLWALLVSAEFAELPLDYFRIGRDMILSTGANGYHVLERMGHLVKNEVAFVHMAGRFKPWSFEQLTDWRRDKAAYLNQLCYELSPFFKAARPFAGRLGRPAWLERRNRLAWLLNALAIGNPALSGLPLALLAWLAAMLFHRQPET
jgi:hypothetical protein